MEMAIFWSFRSTLNYRKKKDDLSLKYLLVFIFIIMAITVWFFAIFLHYFRNNRSGSEKMRGSGYLPNAEECVSG